jgi:hypothetical protein|tara:strand:- start:5478 stop:7574 length:2097 start_codon:yes stop_codon:yes gene_type:complete
MVQVHNGNPNGGGAVTFDTVCTPNNPEINLFKQNASSPTLANSNDFYNSFLGTVGGIPSVGETIRIYGHGTGSGSSGPLQGLAPGTSTTGSIYYTCYEYLGTGAATGINVFYGFNGLTVESSHPSFPANAILCDACAPECCPPGVVDSWNCIGGACIDPGTGNGQYSSLAACQSSCAIVSTSSWNCDCLGNCTDPGNGTGTYSTLASCQAACANNGSSITYIETHNTCDEFLLGQFTVDYSCAGCTIPNPCTPNDDCGGTCFNSIQMWWEYETSPGTWALVNNTMTTTQSGLSYDVFYGQGWSMSSNCFTNHFNQYGDGNYRMKVYVMHIDSSKDYNFEGDPIAWTSQNNYLIICGCIDQTASNYNSSALCDDGSCTYLDYHEWEKCSNGDILNLVELGQAQTSVNTANFYLIAYSPNQGEVMQILFADGSIECYIYLGTNSVPASLGFAGLPSTIITIHNDCASCEVVYGCTDTNASNYNPFATIDDGSCLYPLIICGCTDPTASNYDPTATGDCYDSSNENDCNVIGSVDYNNIGQYGNTSCCDYIDPYGCTDPLACNYNPNATIDDGSCCYPGCIFPAAINYDPTACCDDGSCLYPSGEDIFGCTDPLAINYNPNATIDDGSCLYDGGNGGTNPNPCDTIDITTITPNPCDLLQIAHIWSNRVSTGTGGCVDELLDDLIMSVALYDMLDETIKNN